MKQGEGKSSYSSRKVEPDVECYNPAGVAQIGLTIDPKAKEPMLAGPGLRAPMVSETVHHCGSQAKHEGEDE
jgi:hypothetical protein